MLVKGKDVNIFIKDGGVYKAVSCSQDCSVDITTSLLPATTKGDGGFDRFIPHRISWRMSYSGIVYTNNLSITDLISLQTSRTVVRVQFKLKDLANNEEIFEGDAIIETANITAPHDSVATWNAEFQGSGRLITTSPEVPANANVYSFQYVAEGGEVTISPPKLPDNIIGAELVDLSVEYDLFIRPYPEAIASDEAQFNSAAGEITFGTALTEGQKVTGIYLAP